MTTSDERPVPGQPGTARRATIDDWVDIDNRTTAVRSSAHRLSWAGADSTHAG